MTNRASRSSLFLMELIISILFFALAAMVCVQMFVRSHTLSRDSVELNYAVNWCSNVAECFYACDGDIDKMIDTMDGAFKNPKEEGIVLSYSDEYKLVIDNSEEERYRVIGTLNHNEGLYTLDIVCYDVSKEEVIYTISPKLYVRQELS